MLYEMYSIDSISAVRRQAVKNKINVIVHVNSCSTDIRVSHPTTGKIGIYRLDISG